MAQLQADEIVKILRDQIQNYDSAVNVAEVGYVKSVGDGIAASTAWKRPWLANCWSFPTGCLASR